MFSKAYNKKHKFKDLRKSAVFCELPLISFDLFMKPLLNNIKFFYLYT